MTREDVRVCVHVIGAGLIAGLAELVSEPDPITWRGFAKAAIAGLSVGGAYMLKPPGVMIVKNEDLK